VTSADGRVVRISRAALNPKKEKKKREHVRGPVPVVARQALKRKKYKYMTTEVKVVTIVKIVNRKNRKS